MNVLGEIIKILSRNEKARNCYGELRLEYIRSQGFDVVRVGNHNNNLIKTMVSLGTIERYRRKLNEDYPPSSEVQAIRINEERKWRNDMVSPLVQPTRDEEYCSICRYKVNDLTVHEATSLHKVNALQAEVAL